MAASQGKTLTPQQLSARLNVAETKIIESVGCQTSNFANNFVHTRSQALTHSMGNILRHVSRFEKGR